MTQPLIFFSAWLYPFRISNRRATTRQLARNPRVGGPAQSRGPATLLNDDLLYCEAPIKKKACSGKTSG